MTALLFVKSFKIPLVATLRPPGLLTVQAVTGSFWFLPALVLASGQMGPRLLERFTRDRGHQVTLGTFLGHLSGDLRLRPAGLADRPQRRGDLLRAAPRLDAGAGQPGGPDLLHHIAGGINVGQVIRLVADDLARGVKRSFPLQAGALEQGAPDSFAQTAHALRATQNS